MAFGAFLGSILPSLIGGSLSLKGGRERNAAASAQAQRQMDFQERMSSTAHQREIADLRKAGLNPILSGTGGAGSSSPGGAQASVQDVLTPAVNSALSARRMTQEIKNLEASRQLTMAQKDAIAPASGVGSWIRELIPDTGPRREITLPNFSNFNDFKSLLIDLVRTQGSSARSLARPAEGEKYSLPRLILRNLQIGGK